MTIGYYIKLTDTEVYKKLMELYKMSEPPKEIELGDSVYNLMKHDSHKRVKGKLVQRGWG